MSAGSGRRGPPGAKKRCPWSETDALLRDYHDTEWGVPVHDDRKHFEFLCLEAFQAGLSWLIVLKKREGFRRAFAGFDPKRVAKFGPNEIQALRGNPEIIRNRLKIEATVNNAVRFLEVQKEFGTFDAYIWSFADGKPIVNRWEKQEEIPVTTGLSDRLSKDLKTRGFKFIGSTVIYAHLQAIGIVNDHIRSCFRWSEAGVT